MGFFLSPFRFIFELIGFLISAAFVYGLALIAAFAIIASPYTKAMDNIKPINSNINVNGLIKNLIIISY